MQIHSTLRRWIDYGKHKARSVTSSGFIRAPWSLETYCLVHFNSQGDFVNHVTGVRADHAASNVLYTVIDACYLRRRPTVVTTSNPCGSGVPATTKTTSSRGAPRPDTEEWTARRTLRQVLAHRLAAGSLALFVVPKPFTSIPASC